MTTETTSTRRDLIKKGAVAGGVVWAAPLVTSVGAGAQDISALCEPQPCITSFDLLETGTNGVYNIVNILPVKSSMTCTGGNGQCNPTSVVDSATAILGNITVSGLTVTVTNCAAPGTVRVRLTRVVTCTDFETAACDLTLQFDLAGCPTGPVSGSLVNTNCTACP